MKNFKGVSGSELLVAHAASFARFALVSQIRSAAVQPV